MAEMESGSEDAIQEAKEYQYFQPELMKAIENGNIYNEDEVEQPWTHEAGGPYFTHVKSLSKGWRHLRLLADFMQVSTTPLRWEHFRSGGKWSSEKPNNRQERAARTHVTRLDYMASGGLEKETYRQSAQLRAALDEQLRETNSAQESKKSPEQDTKQRNFRLFIVEDLSRDVIEMLGAHYDIEPTFFRDQIFDYAWYNTRDRWMDPPRLNIVAKRQRWLQIRFATSRYFQTQEDFVEGFNQFESFNVYRRLEDDLNNRGKWDAKGAIVGLSRTRAAFWLGNPEGHAEGAVGVLLVDPTIQIGFPLWQGYRNWEETPSMSSMKGKMPPDGPKRKSFYEDLIYWLEKPDSFAYSPSSNPAANLHMPVQALLYLICGEWLTIAEYIQTRLAQVEWEISFPEHFLIPGDKVDLSLKKLQIWRRLVPTYRGMLTETLERVFDFQCHTVNPASNANSLTKSSNADGVNATSSSNSTEGNHCPCPMHDMSSNTGRLGPINALREDFVRIRSSMEEYQQRIDRLTSFVTSMISINDSHRGLEDSNNVTRLTFLATCFIPLSLTASVFSMQGEISNIKGIIGWYFLTAVLLVLLTIGVMLTLGMVRGLKRSKESKQMRA